MKSHKIIAVTPAGRRVYLDLLKHYILSDPSIDEWHLWDNCREAEDRVWIENFARAEPRVKIVKRPRADGSIKAINGFYETCRDPGVFYIKIDDDLVYMPPDFGHSLYTKALSERDQFTWWSPLVVNNAICLWLLKYHSRVDIAADLMASAACIHGWKSPFFAKSCIGRFSRPHPRTKATASRPMISNCPS